MDIHEVLDQLEGELGRLKLEAWSAPATTWRLKALDVFRRVVQEDDPLVRQLMAVDFSPYPRPSGVGFMPMGWDVFFYAAQTEAAGLIEVLRHRLDLDASGFPIAGGSDPLERLHPAIRQVSGEHFRHGRYRNAILDAFIAVEARTKKLSGLRGVIGVKLMGKVFNEDLPILPLSDLATDTDRDEQEGFKLIFMGAVLGIRNPKAHDIVEQKDPDRTLDYLSFASLLMRRLDDAEALQTT